jgi:hypothetical protein
MIDIEQFEREGFAMTPSLLSSAEVAHLISLIEVQASIDSRRGGIRDILHRVPELRGIAEHATIRSIVEQVIGPNPFVVRSMLFDKTEAANWKVPWHQDLTIAVHSRGDAEGYGHGPSKKASHTFSHQQKCSLAWSPFVSTLTRAPLPTAPSASCPARTSSDA